MDIQELMNANIRFHQDEDVQAINKSEKLSVEGFVFERELTAEERQEVFDWLYAASGLGPKTKRKLPKPPPEPSWYTRLVDVWDPLFGRVYEFLGDSFWMKAVHAADRFVSLVIPRWVVCRKHGHFVVDQVWENMCLMCLKTVGSKSEPVN